MADPEGSGQVRNAAIRPAIISSISRDRVQFKEKGTFFLGNV
jgi:hypothetical protein